MIGILLGMALSYIEWKSVRFPLPFEKGWTGRKLKYPVSLADQLFVIVVVTGLVGLGLLVVNGGVFVDDLPGDGLLAIDAASCLSFLA